MFYRFARRLFWLFFTLICHWQVEGAVNVPKEGPVVLVANHVSYWDPIVLGVAMRRPVTFLAKSELFDLPVLGTLLTWLGAFSLRRGKGDRAALRAALKALEGCGVVALFPEGTRNKGEKLLPFQKGAALLAVKTGAPLVPVALLGTRGFFPGGRPRALRVRIGQPLQTAGRDMNIAELNSQAFRSMAELLEF